MERGDHAAVATFFADADLIAGRQLDLGDAAAQHARVRRLSEADPVRITNGCGTIAQGTIARLTRSALTVVVHDISTVPLPARLSLYLPVADRDRMLWLAEKSTELAVRVWQPVVFRRSASVNPRGEGEAFAKKTRARMISALEQSGGAWLPEIMEPLPLAEALVRSGAGGGDRFLLERGAAPLGRARLQAAVMVGPEGGIESGERSLIVDAHHWMTASLGETTLRFETAAIVAVGILRAG